MVTFIQAPHLLHFQGGAQGVCEILPCEHLRVVDVGEGHAPEQIWGPLEGT